ncbi:MAG: phosphomevalonate kinase [Candidatus Aenigmatarchaeota archaeon]|nr:phosphomevalonate kinase [Candidatus Aenigmarchaeota archaeon]
MLISAPGKLFIAGEWAILELGNPGIVASIDKRVYVELDKINNKKEKNKILLTFEEIGTKNIEARFEDNELKIFSKVKKETKEYMKFVKAAIEIALLYIREFKPFKIRTWGKGTSIKMGKNLIKIGFGSSAACTVATIASILKFHNHDIESEDAKERIYKLATIAHYIAQGKLGSGFDIASSCYGGIFAYYRFDPNWLNERIEINNGKIVVKEDLKKIVDKKWPYFKIERLPMLKDFQLLVGWTGEKASTSEMIKRINEWRAKSGEEEYKAFCSNVNSLVNNLIIAWKKEDKKKILELIRKNEEYLRELGKRADVNIETEKLRKLSEIANSLGGAGKLSGAGGGDCGIAITFSKEIARKIKNNWKRDNIVPLDVSISKDGFKKEY